MAFLDFGPDDRPADAVFLHANGFNALTYRHVLAPLATHFRILAIDQRGRGGTSLETVVEGRPDWLDLRDDLLAFLDALELTHVVLSGRSWAPRPPSARPPWRPRAAVASCCSIR